jgi:Domain of unknown function (DUF4214)/Dual-action HEIGH metallo-peptidase
VQKMLSLVMFALACAPAEETPTTQGETWEQFEARSTHVVNGQTVYIVEWDLVVSHEELRAYYDATVTSGPATDGLGTAAQSLIVKSTRDVDDIWPNDRRHHLSYCVSNTFGSLKERVVSEMWAVTAAWEGVAGVRFIYDASQDGNCDLDPNSNTPLSNVVIHVQPLTSDSAVGFASYPSARYGYIGIDYATIDTEPIYKGTSIAIVAHELGHVLGFRHEHIRPENGACGTEDSSWRELTPYDRESVMHYPYCNGVPNTKLRAYPLSNLDRQGAERLYGPGNTPAGTNAINRPEFFVRQIYRDVLGREPEAAALANGTNWLQACNETNRTCGAYIDFTRSVFESQEHRTKHPELTPGSPGYNAAYVTRLYTSLLRRQPDTEGYNWWLNALTTSGDYRGVISGFINSSEYGLRFGNQN